MRQGLDLHRPLIPRLFHGLYIHNCLDKVQCLISCETPRHKPSVVWPALVIESRVTSQLSQESLAIAACDGLSQ
jgi:hypothetical protein